MRCKDHMLISKTRIWFAAILSVRIQWKEIYQYFNSPLGMPSSYDQFKCNQLRVYRKGIYAFLKHATSKPERLFVWVAGWLAGPSSLFLEDLTVTDWHRQNAVINKVHHSEKTGH